MSETTTIKLLSPIEAHGEARRELVFREPTGADVQACGIAGRQSTAADGNTYSSLDTGVIGAYISRLAGIPPSSVAKLSARDWLRCMNVVTAFLAEDEEEEAETDPTSSTDTSILPGSGNGRLEPPLS